jgi:hypothetical protein
MNRKSHNSLNFKQGIVFALYVLFSLRIFLAFNFSSLAWLIYLFFLTPFYLLCLIAIFARHPRISIKTKLLLLSIVTTIVAQILIVLSAPTDCYLWSQGRNCYSFLQSQIQHTGFRGVFPDPPHWDLFELLFPISLLAYMISISICLNSITQSEK